jgi:hypothetical protein
MGRGLELYLSVPGHGPAVGFCERNNVPCLIVGFLRRTLIHIVS